MAEYIIRKPNGRRFRLVASHTGTAPLDKEPLKHPDCRGCGTKTVKTQG